MRQYIHIIITTIFIMFISGCLNEPVTSTKQGITLRNAINTNDFTLLADSITFPLAVTKQDWKTADDGYGYVLANKKNHLSNNSKDLAAVFKILEHVEIEGKEPLSQELTVTDFSNEFEGVEHYWNTLDLVVFFRGEGDVEHIVILGLDKESAKLRAIYIN